MPAPTSAGTAAASRIASGCRLEGDLNFTGPLILAGHVRGSVTCLGTLTVEAGASIEGRVEAEDIIVRGSLRGDIAASRLIEVYTGGEIDGVIYAPSIQVAPGTRIDGDVMIAPERSEAHIARARSMADLEARKKQLHKADPAPAAPAAGSGPTAATGS